MFFGVYQLVVDGVDFGFVFDYVVGFVQQGIDDQLQVLFVVVDYYFVFFFGEFFVFISKQGDVFVDFFCDVFCYYVVFGYVDELVFD